MKIVQVYEDNCHLVQIWWNSSSYFSNLVKCYLINIITAVAVSSVSIRTGATLHPIHRLDTHVRTETYTRSTLLLHCSTTQACNTSTQMCKFIEYNHSLINRCYFDICWLKVICTSEAIFAKCSPIQLQHRIIFLFFLVFMTKDTNIRSVRVRKTLCSTVSCALGYFDLWLDHLVTICGDNC